MMGSCLRSRKAPGPDGVTLEMLSLGREVAIRWLKSIHKVFAKAILNRLNPRVKQLLQESHRGFCHGRGHADQLSSLRMLVEKAREYHQPINACFIDLKKAYDSVHRESLWRILQHSYCLPLKLLSIMRALHEDSTAAVRAYGKLPDKFSVTSGVLQGCVLAPTHFNFYFDVAIRMALEGVALGWPACLMLI